MTSALKIPDLRFEQSFMRALHANTVKTSTSVNVAEDAKEQEDPLPVEITPSIVIYTILKDQILMPFVQGLAMTSVLLLFKPILYKVFENGRNFGMKLFNGLGFSHKPNRSFKRI